MMLLKKLASVAIATVVASLLGLVITAWVMGQTKTDTEAATLENASVLPKKDQGDKKNDKGLAKEAIAADKSIEKNGLSVSLIAVKQQFLEGETLQFRATFKNVSDQEFRLYDPVWYRDWELAIFGGPWRAVSLRKGKRQPAVLVLKPGHELAVDVKIDDTLEYHWGGPRPRKPVPPRKHLKPGKYTLHAAIKFIKNETPGAPFWTGTIRTPPAAFEIALPKPLPDEVVRTWKDAGARVGLMWVDRSGGIHFNTWKEEPGGQIPGFQLGKWRDGVLSKLPDPGMPFGLDLSGSKVTDAGLKTLFGLKSLQMLHLGVTQVTDEGLKELTGLKSLQALDLGSTQVTDAGLKELAGMKSLQSLKLFKTRVTDAGLKELTESKNLQTLNLFNTQVTDAGLKELAGLKTLQSLDLGSTEVTNAGLKELAGLKNLQTLDLQSTHVTSAGLKAVAGLKSLQTLNLLHTKVTDAGLKELAGLEALRTLYLYATPVTDAGLKELAGLKSLHSLSLGNTQVTDAGLQELAGLKSLQWLSLLNTQVTGAGLKELAGLKSLQMLDLSGTKVTDAGLKKLAGLKSLQTLYLYNTKVTDAGLKELAGLKSLQRLNLQSTHVTAAGVAELRKVLPGCKIDR